MNIKKHSNLYHVNISNSHHTGLNGSKRYKCDTSYCTLHTTPHSTPHTTHNSVNRKKAGIINSNLNSNLNSHSNSHSNSNSNDVNIPTVQVTVLPENAYVTRAAVVDYCK